MSTDFSSLDKLMELGMSMALARQMMDTMNYTMEHTRVAGVNATPAQQMPSAAQETWYAAINGHQAGPLSYSELKALVNNGSLTANTLLWCPGMTAWKRALDLPVINKLLLLRN